MNRKSPSREILKRLEEAGVPKTQIAKRLVLAPSSVSDLYKGERHLKHDEAIKLLDMLPDEDRSRELPLIGMAGAGTWLEAVDVTRRSVPVPAPMKGKFATEIVGDSMNLLLPEGAVAVIDPGDTDLYVGKIYLLLNEDGEATIKRYRSDPARFEPVSDNPAHESFPLSSGGFRVIGRVSGGIQFF